MKRIILFASLFSVVFAGYAQSSTPKGAESAIKMVQEKYDLGTVAQGQSKTFYMEFVNQTPRPVVVKNVMAGCGCTIPEKPKQPVMPGKTGKIKVAYNAQSVGPINKDVEIYIAGYDAPKIVYFTGEVTAKK